MLKNKNQYQFFCGVVILSYLIIYGTFLFLTNFLPYVFDNNESFSALLQAKNLFDFGLHKSFGLTDEAIGPLSAAHPYVYTHQGNFPRFYTLLLYSFGLHGIESQLFVTTFTIGLIGILFCYHFFAKHVSNLFALIFCLLLMTDYLMFAQWQVNLLRVWHLFFFFSSFLCCHGLQSNRRKLFIFLSIANFACLLYMELAYAAFVSLSAIAYVSLQKTHLRAKVLDGFMIGIGLFIGVGVIVLQDIAFLGWENFFQDLTYTFKARNQLFSSEETLKHILKFCADNKIAFWVNFNTVEGIRNPNLFLHFFYRYCLLPYTPFLTVSACIAVLSSALFYLSELPKKSEVFLHSSKTSRVCFILIASIFLSISLLALTYISYPTLLGKKAYLVELSHASSLVSFVACMTFFAFYNYSNFKQNSSSQYFFSSLFFGFTFLLGVLFYKLEIYTGNLSHLLNTIVTKALGGVGWYPTIFGLLLLLLCPNQAQRELLQKQNKTFKNLLPFVLASIIGCFAAYLLFPGYIRTAYMLRYCSFSVFAHLVLYVWLFYILASQLIYEWHTQLKAHALLSFSMLRLIVALFLLSVFSYGWLYLQKTYIFEFPANHYQQLINTFKKETYHHQPFISNNYAAPYAYTNDAWGYLDPAFGHSKLNKQGTNFNVQHDNTYLWFADVTSNKSYTKPSLYICWLNYSFDELGNNGAKCGEIFSLINAIRFNKGKDSGFIELERDMSGHDKWSIIKLSNNKITQ